MNCLARLVNQVSDAENLREQPGYPPPHPSIADSIYGESLHIATSCPSWAFALRLAGHKPCYLLAGTAFRRSQRHDKERVLRDPATDPGSEE
jgi:hypothetical protein